MRRYGSFGALVGGYLVGGVTLGAILLALQHGVAPLVDDVDDTARLWIAGGVALALVLGDLWATIRRRMYPLGLRRQARKGFMYGRHHPSTVGFVWGFDAGLGFTTYRMTSGVWLLGALVVLDAVDAWTAVVYAGGFVVGLTSFVFWPTRGATPDERSEAVTQRVLRMVDQRRVPQIAYLLVFPFAVVPLLLGV